MDTLPHSWGQSDTLRGGGRGLEGEPPPKIASAEAYIGGWPPSGPVPHKPSHKLILASQRQLQPFSPTQGEWQPWGSEEGGGIGERS